MINTINDLKGAMVEENVKFNIKHDSTSILDNRVFICIKNNNNNRSANFWNDINKENIFAEVEDDNLIFVEK